MLLSPWVLYQCGMVVRPCRNSTSVGKLNPKPGLRLCSFGKQANPAGSRGVVNRSPVPLITHCGVDMMEAHAVVPAQ